VYERVLLCDWPAEDESVPAGDRELAEPQGVFFLQF